MPDVAELEGMYLGTRTTFSGMLKWSQVMPVIGIMPFNKFGDNTLSSPFSPLITAKQIEPYTYNFNLLNMKMILKASVDDKRTMMSIPIWDYVKTSYKKVIFWYSTLIFFALPVIYSIISLICTLV